MNKPPMHDDAARADLASDHILKKLREEHWDQGTLIALARKLVTAPSENQKADQVECKEADAISVGDVVTLRGDNKRLTVTSLDPEFADVAWFNHCNKYEEVNVPVVALRKYTDEIPF